MRTSPDWLLKMGGLCAASQYLLAPTLDRVTIAPGTAFFLNPRCSLSFVAKQPEKREMMAGLLHGQDYT